jgi:hypothetical protein
VPTAGLVPHHSWCLIDVGPLVPEASLFTWASPQGGRVCVSVRQAAPGPSVILGTS